MIEKKVASLNDEAPTKEIIVDVTNKFKNVVSVPFPQRLKDQKKDKEFSRFLEIFRKLHIYIQFVEAIAQMPLC
ncbi:hypothetical protein CR513_13266, partial [Mucuna pruriens]